MVVVEDNRGDRFHVVVGARLSLGIESRAPASKLTLGIILVLPRRSAEELLELIGLLDKNTERAYSSVAALEQGKAPRKPRDLFHD